MCSRYASCGHSRSLQQAHTARRNTREGHANSNSHCNCKCKCKGAATIQRWPPCVAFRWVTTARDGASTSGMWQSWAQALASPAVSAATQQPSIKPPSQPAARPHLDEVAVLGHEHAFVCDVQCRKEQRDRNSDRKSELRHQPMPCTAINSHDSSGHTSDIGRTQNAAEPNTR